MIDLSLRSTLPEKMDDLNAPKTELYQNLRELEVINSLLGGYSVVLGALNSLKLPGKQLGIADLGCGGGDMLRAVAKWAKKKNKEVKLLGVDLNPVMIEYANAVSQNFPNIQYRVANVFDDELLNEKLDIVICSLFCHHFEDKQLVLLLKRMRLLAGKAIIINDLHRHSIAYYAIGMLTSLFSKTYMVKHDAKLSVARAFKRREWKQLLASAGITNYTLKWRWAWRWELVINSADEQ
jgi:2-polyprenyl-3-methyl-5-hydroxy-6-metoxy-1,4-benzoquinol methylase